MNRNLIKFLTFCFVLILIVFAYLYLIKNKNIELIQKHYLFQRFKTIDLINKNDNKIVNNDPCKQSELYNPVRVANLLEVGSYLSDYNCMTLYTYSKDDINQSNCLGFCLMLWRPFIFNESKLSNFSDEIRSKLGYIKISGDIYQYTYEGKPLYYYNQDKKPGEIKGNGLGNVLPENEVTLENKGFDDSNSWSLIRLK